MTAEPTQAGLFTAFQRVDVDGDGQLDLVGFTVILEELGLSWSRHETQDRFETADANRDGLISLDELSAMLAGYGLAG
ncbi:EF-hand domain-containing protein [Thermomonospora umbrina]|uniref:EF hand domain-containing protein n=1 Tax=Thermomonospora umbrina TaxID=111806 RepID=A0A3D9SYT7_9ACTN|nr:EF-hand domain-containing protein [Thermomonospora umbrina]REE96781.1 EF hand domain-containing protein [Thermomonospora umbrina]